jgi:hypothetical protein
MSSRSAFRAVRCVEPESRAAEGRPAGTERSEALYAGVVRVTAAPIMDLARQLRWGA